MNHRLLFFLVLPLVALLTSCTSVRVEQASPGRKPLKLVHIEQNIDPDFDEIRNVVDTGFQKRGIETKVVPQGTAPADTYVLSYSADNGWDLVTFLKHVDLRLKEGNRLVATATYHHYGGYALTKYGSTQRKVAPLVNKLIDKASTR